MTDDLFDMIAVAMADLFGKGPGVQVGNPRWAGRAAKAMAEARGWAIRDMTHQGWTVGGDADGIAVNVRLWVEGNEEEWALRCEGGASGAPPQYVVSAAGRKARSSYPTGDDAFDARVRVVADEAPWWSAETRAAVLRAVSIGVTFDHGLVEFSNEHRTSSGERGIAELTDAAIAAIHAMCDGEVDPLDAAHVDPDPGVRRRAMHHLASIGAEVPWLELTGDPDPSVAVLAAIQAGPDGLPILRRLLDSAAREEALVALVNGGAGPDAAFDQALARLLAESPAEEWIDLAGRIGGLGVVPALRAVRGPRRPRAAAAVNRVHRRLGLDRGAVSLADVGAAGALSEVDAARGAVSPADDQ